jgi:YD repeat-containing protein
MFCRICLLAILLPNLALAAEKKPDELILSTPDQLAHQDCLVGHLIGPLGGQLVLKQTDLLTQGAEPLSLERYYIPPTILPSYHPKGGNADIQYLYRAMHGAYRGWEVMPHLRLQVFGLNPLVVRVTDATGTTLDYCSLNGKTELLTEPHGISNYAGGTPGGQHDPRNTQIALENQNIIVISPDGIKRTYRRGFPFYLLEKEQLPNGEVRRYEVCNRGLGPAFARVTSFDPKEQHVYASIAMTGAPHLGNCEFKSALGQTVTYEYENRPVSGKWDQHKHRDRREFDDVSPPLLTAVKRPLQTETIAYNERFLLDRYCSDDACCQCQYGVRSNKLPFTVNALRLPVGDNDAFVDVHKLRCEPPVAKRRDGMTSVDNADGTRTVYHYTKNFLPQKIVYYDANQQLIKQTVYEWTADQRLQSISWTDREDYALCRKTYAYDAFGNPIEETLTGDLTGHGSDDTYTIYRQFSTDGRHLLLREETQNGKVLTFQYLPDTNLPIAKFTQEGDQILYREFWEYDDGCNLICEIADDGTGTTITSYELRQEQPFLHMPEWTEESYWGEGQRHVLTRTHHAYDAYGNVCQDTVYDAQGRLAYQVQRTYDIEGHLLSETNALGQETSYRYDDKGRCVHTSAAGLETDWTYDARGRLRQKCESGGDGAHHTTSYRYDVHDRLIESTDTFGNPTRYTYDLVSNQVTVTESPAIHSLDGNPIPVITRCHYDAFGRKMDEVDANGNITTLRSNAYGSPTEIIHPDGAHRRLRKHHAYPVRRIARGTHTDDNGPARHKSHRDIRSLWPRIQKRDLRSAADAVLSGNALRCRWKPTEALRSYLSRWRISKNAVH